MNPLDLIKAMQAKSAQAAQPTPTPQPKPLKGAGAVQHPHIQRVEQAETVAIPTGLTKAEQAVWVLEHHKGTPMQSIQVRDLCFRYFGASYTHLTSVLVQLVGKGKVERAGNNGVAQLFVIN